MILLHSTATEKLNKEIKRKMNAHIHDILRLFWYKTVTFSTAFAFGNDNTKFILKILIRKMMYFVFWQGLKHQHSRATVFFQLKPGHKRRILTRLTDASRAGWENS